MRLKSSLVSGFSVFCVSALLTGASCQRQLKSDLPIVHLRIKGFEIRSEVAFKPATRTTGLMFRRELGRDDGMLFVFPDSAPRAFWMKNTLIPLSIAFLDAKGRILNVLEMPPLTEESFPSDGSAQFALEMNAGWYGRHGIKAGDVVEGVLEAPRGE